ncbi:YhcN/YlaJ family sporulation lipoprotein [Paenibacillus pinistramenti]|uniref:YhcN/YlaJ family sporulation lipoprotein n=1 Tax=Paenibacillus pinistramenti TaxID=1768003 RepID=UPI001107E691|nr:YhcN/YlaJ family sporulation lipoprotein [Paenibacillus pinistramenti]
MRASKPVALSLSAALLVGVGLTGCGDNNSKVGTQGVKNQSAHRLNINSADQARAGLTNMRYSKSLSQKVTELGSVHSARVMTSGSEAFVAVRMNGTNPSTTGGTRASADRMGTRSLSGTGTGTMNIPNRPDMTVPRTQGTGNVIGNPGMMGRSPGQGVNPGGSDYRPNGVTGSAGLGFSGGVSGGTNKQGGYYPNPGTIYDGSRLGGGLGVQADNNRPGSRMNGAGSTGGYNTLSTDNNSMTNNVGTGSGTANNSNIPANVRTEIEQAVKGAAPHIQNVYISDDSDFMDRLGSFSTDGMTLGNNPLTNGVRNATNDLGQMIDRLFPDRMRNMTNTSGYNTNGINNNTRFDMNPNR